MPAMALFDNGWRGSLESCCQSDELSPSVKAVGIETGDRDQSKDLAADCIEQNARDALLAGATLRDKLLHRHIEPDDNVLSGLSIDMGEFAHDSANGVDLDLPRAGGAAQRHVFSFFDAGLADAKVRQLEQRIAGEFLFGNRGNVADHMRCSFPKRVIPGEALFDRETRQLWDQPPRPWPSRPS